MADELVLIVEDDDKNLRLARDVLRHAGFRTIEARTAVDGVSLAVEHLPDLVLMDMRLPTGFDDYLVKPISVRDFGDQIRSRLL